MAAERQAVIEQRMVERFSDPHEALEQMGLREAVVRKFGEQLTLEDYLGQARRAVMGFEYVRETPLDQDSDLAKAAARDTAIHWLRTASVGKEDLMHHSDPTIRKFGRRMYIELNPDEYTEEQLAALKKEWKL